MPDYRTILGRDKWSFIGHWIGLAKALTGEGSHPGPNLHTTNHTTKQEADVIFPGTCGLPWHTYPAFHDAGQLMIRLSEKGSAEKDSMATGSAAIFWMLQTALPHAPVLENPDFNKPFTSCMGVSNSRLEAILSQEVERKQHSIFFISCNLQVAEVKFTTTEKETLTIK